MAEAPEHTGTDESAAGQTLEPESAARAAESASLSGSKLGRYLVLEQLGHGGMGVVYKAYDPQLDRRVALKVLRIRERSKDSADRARERMLREAQALAQLNHPHVVAVYDVGTVDSGPFQDAVYMTMEYVEGQTLREWLKERHPPVRQILEVLIAAGRGIAAAHQAGLVHRDIKPQNIIVGKDGRVRVLDFGLARSIALSMLSSETPYLSGSGDSASREALPPLEESFSSDRKLAAPITLEGHVMGTPGYLAPEQYLGKELTPLTDQFSFCVTLYEALFGKRPFSARAHHVLRYKVITGRVDPAPAESQVPGWLRRIVLKGLAVKESDRYPSLDALLSDLSFDPGAAWLRAGLIAGAVVLLAFALGAVLFAQARRQELCAGYEERLGGVWDDGVARAIKSAFLASGRPYAQDTFDRASAALNLRARAWMAMAQDTCAATHVRQEQSDQLLDLRMQCLDRKRGELKALTALFARKPDGEVLDNAVAATLGLPPLARCADAAALTSAFPPPEDPTVAARVGALRPRPAWRRRRSWPPRPETTTWWP